MKYLIISFLLLAGCMQEVKQESMIELDASLNITKIEVGFNIYSNTGELILAISIYLCNSPLKPENLRNAVELLN